MGETRKLAAILVADVGSPMRTSTAERAIQVQSSGWREGQIGQAIVSPRNSRGLTRSRNAKVLVSLGGWQEPKWPTYGKTSRNRN